MSRYKILKSFYKEILSVQSGGGKTGYWALAGLLEVFHAVSMMVPYQEIMFEKAFLSIPLVFGTLGPTCYLVPYYNIIEEGKPVKIYEKLKYLPVDIRDIQKMRVECLFFFVVRIFPVMLCMQLLFSGLYFKEIWIENILYAVLFGLILPFLFNLPIAWLEIK